MTITVSPCPILAMLSAAPTPVMTPQPMRHARSLVWHDAVFAERAQIHEQFESTAVRESGARCAVKGDCLRSTCKICLAQDEQISVAVETVAAMRIPRKDNVISHSYAARVRAGRFHDAGRLMAEYDWHRIAK